MGFKFNWEFLKNPTFYNSLGLLAVYMMLGKFAGPRFEKIADVLLVCGAAGTIVFLIKRMFFEAK